MCASFGNVRMRAPRTRASQTVATHWNTLQRTATHCNILQNTATHCASHACNPNHWTRRSGLRSLRLPELQQGFGPNHRSFLWEGPINYSRNSDSREYLNAELVLKGCCNVLQCVAVCMFIRNGSQTDLLSWPLANVNVCACVYTHMYTYIYIYTCTYVHMYVRFFV